MQFGSSADYQLQAYRESGGELSAVLRWIEVATVSRSDPPRTHAPVEPAQ